MYVVLTIGELKLHSGLGMEVTDSMGWDPRDLWPENTGLDERQIEEFEVCISEETARRFGIVSDRGERWISNFFRLPDGFTFQFARPPVRDLPRPGKPVQMTLLPPVADLPQVTPTEKG